MAELAGVTSRTILNWMIRFGIPRRTQPEALRGKYTGSKAPFWGKTHPPEVRAKISANHADVSGSKNPMFGKTGDQAPGRRVKSVAEKRKLSLALKGRKRPEVTGHLNGFWKGGRTPFLVAVRNLPRCIAWRDAVYARDHYTCQDCGDAKGGNLNAHHLTPLAQLLNELGIKTAPDANTCEALWEISNGITLCERCHRLRHSHYPCGRTVT